MQIRKHIILYSSCLLFCLFSNCIFSQNEKFYPEFNRYSSWSVGGSYYYQQKDKKNHIYGDYNYNPKFMNGFNISIRKTFNKTGKFSYITGLTLNFNTVYKFGVYLKKEDINSPVFTEDFNFSYTPMDKRMNFSMPFLVQFKKKVSNNMFFNIQTGIDLLYMESGGADRTVYINNENDIEVPRFYYESYSKSNIKLYPNAIISPGFYFIFDKFLLQTNVIYNKAIIPQYEGFMYFDNLKPEGKTLIENKRSGDYLGISLHLHLKNRN